MWAFLHLIAARVLGFLRRDQQDREFARELEAHLTMAEEDKIRQGMTPKQARREARLELGGLTQLLEAGRETRGLPWLGTFWLDTKLGFRRLRKAWGLTLVGGLAMTTAIVIGVAVFMLFELAYGGTLPLDDGDRVVAIETWDESAQRLHAISFLDLQRWQETLRSLEDIGAFRTIQRNLLLGIDSSGAMPAGSSAEPVHIAEMTASGFRLARVLPLLGRPLVREDELPGAAPVVVIGYDVWQSRFSGDPAVVGRSIGLGGTVHTLVGVMPKGFAFPIHHRFWIPLRAGRATLLPTNQEALDPADQAPAAFARLAPGATMERAQAELESLGLLSSASLPPAAAERLRPRVRPFTVAMTGEEDRWLVRLALVLVSLLLVPPCANVGILVYARVILRQEEFAARYALGASRGRIVAQLFVEMLVLAAGAAAMALLVVGLFLRWAESNLISQSEGGTPFWMEFNLSFRAVLFAAGLAVGAALITGLLPGLKATGRRIHIGLHALGNRTGPRLGGTWTTLVVAQVALSLAALPAAVEIGWGTIRKGVLGPGFEAGDYLTAKLAMDRQGRSSTVLSEDGAEGDPRSFAAASVPSRQS